MSTILPLRRYQREAIDAFRAKLSPDVNRLALVLATGLGKTVIFAHAAREHLDAYPDQRVLVLVHTDELVRQAAKKIRDIAPHLSVGIVKAAQDEVTADVIVASVQTLRSETRRNRITRVGLVIVDECHHSVAPTYRMILAHYGCMAQARKVCSACAAPGDATVAEVGRRITAPRHCPDPACGSNDRHTPALGVTATLMRGDGGPLGEIWQGVAFSRDIGYGVRQRFLIPPRGRAVEVPDLDFSRVRTTKADFRDGDLGSAIVDSLAPSTVADAYVQHAKDRSGIMFCPTVASAEVMAEAMNEAGIVTEVIHGQLGMDERRAILDRLESGQTQVLANCMVLTEGFDSPRVSCVVVARPTKSKGLYIQMVGRGLRVDPLLPYEDQDCLVLDVVRVADQHDLCSIADLSDKPLDPKKAREGKTLLDLEDEFDRGEGVEPDAPEHWTGPVKVREFDPLASRSTRNWGKTKGGAYFMPAGKAAYVFIVDGAVVWCTRDGRPYVCPSRMHDARCIPLHQRRGGITEHRDLDLETAMGWAEDLAVDMGQDPYETLTSKKAPWRKRKASDNTRQMGMAQALGIKVREGMRAGELSDLIDTIMATRVVDAWAPKVRAALGHTEREKVAA